MTTRRLNATVFHIIKAILAGSEFLSFAAETMDWSLILLLTGNYVFCGAFIGLQAGLAYLSQASPTSPVSLESSSLTFIHSAGLHRRPYMPTRYNTGG